MRTRPQHPSPRRPRDRYVVPCGTIRSARGGGTYHPGRGCSVIASRTNDSLQLPLRGAEVERELTERGLTSFLARVRRELRARYEADLVDALEVPRGALHFAFLSAWAYLAYAHTPRSVLLAVTAAVTGLVFAFETIKTVDHPAVATLLRLLRPFLRDPEIEARMTSAAGTMLALVVAALAFPLPAASLAVAFLAAGDPASRATRKVASRFGLSAPIVQATSFAVMTFVCFVLGTLFSQLSWLQLLLASTAASFAETFLEVRVTARLTLDDNFFIPVFSGLALTTFFL